ncbi:hypothetical protein [Sagittula sp. MA-2]|jgi:hypothetical protein|uniref:hypothetical protein n=1 Tax=Sagittula sp. MA-2 TaxID=3048007 RepID=UPI0024C2E5ED|nr:hypothetical protein [Sagittula sp. MA-2]WHZ35030.1 hypothetical protein QNI11_20670 [Sagittula sp. MA-2]
MDRRTALTTVLAAPFLLPTLARAADGPAKIRELYEKNGDFSSFAQDASGSRILFEGFMAPPLKAESRFFVLTKRPMAVCPFCETEAEWPDDILAVYTKRIVDVEPFNVKLAVRGDLTLGAYKDPDTGFLSMARLTNATYERA